MNIGRNMTINAAMLGLFAIIGTILVVVTYQSTSEQIANNKRDYTLKRLHELITPDMHDNDLEQDRIKVTDPLLGSKDPVEVFRARKDGKPVAAIISAIAPNGYSGRIELLVAIRHDGTLAGVRAIEHHETPGLGDAIDKSKSDWIDQFRDKSLTNPKPNKWKVLRDQGEFDHITSATITSRAVVESVYNSLVYFEKHRNELFDTPTEEK
jgi:electron transport complex protein RnfG